MLNCISLNPSGFCAVSAHLGAVHSWRSAPLLPMWVHCKPHESRHAAWRSSDQSRADDAAWLHLVLQAKHFMRLWRKLCLAVHPDKGGDRQLPNLSFHETLPGDMGLVAEGSKVQQPCICANLPFSAHRPHLHLCLQQ